MAADPPIRTATSCSAREIDDPVLALLIASDQVAPMIAGVAVPTGSGAIRHPILGSTGPMTGG
ncbi:hypothetical protein [Sphingomonas sp. CFBP 8760]|uniref:hypothetical protein n=1 Tax=Sphingomonas sp. CFBP 8760 TaxID=2775282 RepID=UPI001A92505F|nr:hypothetical protein [Sphingomonas sp. CFBP 8760]